MNKKNIVHLIPTIGIGGAEKVVLNISKNFNREKYRVTVVYWRNYEELLDELKKTGVDVIKLDITETISWNTVSQVSKILKLKSADLLHTHFFDGDLIGLFASFICKVPLIINIHSYPFPIEKRHCLRYKIISLFAKKVLCVSQTVRNYVQKMTNINQNKLEVVQNGIEIDSRYDSVTDNELTILRDNFNINEDQIVLGNISRLILDKGQKHLIEAMPILIKKYPNIKLLIIGDGPLESSLKVITDHLNLSKYITFTGTMTNIPALLKLFDYFVFPTFNEALGITVLEAMAAGKPIVATKDAAIPELITHNKEGLLIDPGDSLQIANAVISLIENKEQSQIFANNAKEKVKQFSSINMVNSLENIYSKILF